MFDFTTADLEQMRQRGSNPEDVQRQLENFRNGFDFVDLNRAATVDDGIVQLNEEQLEELVADYPDLISDLQLVKFVPASGAASRMFKELYSYLSENTPEIQSKALTFLKDLQKYPFYEALAEVLLRDGYSLADEVQKANYTLIVRYILGEEGLNYGNQPKGLLLFHRYEDQIRTSVEEHLVEAALYANNGGECNLHFTISPQHQAGFEALLAKVLPTYEERYRVKYHIEFSIQDPATDTVAAELDNTPFRDENGQLLFRPAGHGALIYNINRLDADIAFVKNIDNVIPEGKISTTVQYKKALAAYLIQLQERLFNYLYMLENDNVDSMLLCEILDFAETELMINMEGDFSQESLIERLNRPIRVCGMVRNEGEPGGGPFWVLDENGNLSLQVVESSQINHQDPEQKKIMTQATHFNPVDMVCGLKNYHHEPFNLLDYVDPATGFISTKSYGDRTLKAQELPGLWNGAMSDWITIFVEVPLTTFAPVKTVFDLLKHQN